MSVQITGDNFDSEILRSPIPALVDFWASWCGPCKMIGPLLEQLADEYQGRLKIGKVNVDEESGLAQRHNITSIPSLILYKDGGIVRQQAGALPRHEIENLFKDFL